MPYTTTTATTTNLSTISLPDFTSVAQIMFQDQAKKVEPKARQLFRYEPVGNNQGTEKLLQEYDSQTFARFKGEGANVQKAQAGTGYSILVTLKRYGVEIDVTEEERMYNKYTQVFNKIIDLSQF